MGWDISELEEKDIQLVSFSDLSFSSQQAYNLFCALPDKIDGMGAGWYGKDFASLEFIMMISGVISKSRTFALLLICIDEFKKYCDSERKIIESKITPKARR